MGVCVLRSRGLDEASCVGRWTFAGRGREKGWDSSNKGGLDKDMYPRSSASQPVDIVCPMPE
jgi:hypothetical protein